LTAYRNINCNNIFQSIANLSQNGRSKHADSKKPTNAAKTSD
jgi:hypothetical protein